MNPNEVRQLSDEQIKGEVHAAREKLFKLRTQAVTEKVENTGLFRTTRKDLARLLTERTARRLKHKGAGKPAAAPVAAKTSVKKPAGKKPVVAGVSGKPVRSKSAGKKPSGGKKSAKSS